MMYLLRNSVLEHLKFMTLCGLASTHDFNWSTEQSEVEA